MANADGDRRHSVVRLTLELVEQSIVLFFLELKLAAVEIRRNIKSVEKGVACLAIGAFLMMCALLALIGTAVAALATILPVWLAALLVSALLLFCASALLFTGFSKMKHFSLVPSDTLHRVQVISRQLKKHAEQRLH